MKKLVTSILILTLMSGYAQDLYEISHVVQIELEFSDPNWENILHQYYANDQDERLSAQCVIDGVSYDSVGVKFKGNSTYNTSNDKNPLNIKLDYLYEQDHQGYNTLKLSNGDKDPSFVREVLSYEIGRKYMDVPLSNYAEVTINGTYYGLFCSSESINGSYMERRFYCDDDNTRIKCNPESVFGGNGSNLAYLGSDTALYYTSYELMSDYGWTDLATFCYQLQFNLANIESYIDVDRALWMLAFNNVLVNLDSYTGPFRQNYYMIMDDNGRMLPIIWDLNQCIGSFSMLNMPSGPPSPSVLSDLTEMDPYLRETDSGFPLIYYLFANTRYRKMYLAHCKTILEENIANNAYYTRAQELQAIIGAKVQNDPNGFYTYAQFTSNLDNTVTSGGPGPSGGIYGIAEIMGGRLTYLQAHAAFNLTAPIISNLNISPAAPQAFDNVTFTAEIQNASYAYMGYRSYKGDPFTKTELFDDGLHNDGAAGDDIWGTTLILGATDIQYYFYADNNDVGIFSPVRAEHEFYELTLTGGVVINEMMAQNYAVAADQDGEYDDWIELYNNSAVAVDLSGYYLSDNALNPIQWKIPDGTTINANDYLIIWCDKDTLQAGLHANFKLTGSGETILLADATGTPINEVQFPVVGSNLTYGRYPNGTGGYIPMTSTFSAENSYTNIGLEEMTVEIEVLVYPNPSSDFVTIQTNELSSLNLCIYSLDGSLILKGQLSDKLTIDVSDWKSGIYLITLPDKGITRKLMVQ